MTAWSGVRSSWLIVARNSSLSRFAASASCRASRLCLKQARTVDGLRRTLREGRDERPVGLWELMEAPEHERHGAEGSLLERQRDRGQRLVAIVASLGERRVTAGDLLVRRKKERRLRADSFR